MSGETEIFFHVGLGKVASTFLQHSVFPKLKGIHYIPTSQYKRSKQIINQKGPGKYLVSREFDLQFDREVKWFTETFPQTKIIVLLRRHDSWIASQYRRYVKNGWYWDFDQFFNLRDTGFWKKKDLLFFPKIEIIKRCCKHPPLVLLYDELKEEPWATIDRLSVFTGTSYTQAEISLDVVHKSYSNKQLVVLRSFCRRFVRFVPREKKNKIWHWLSYRPWWAFFHLVMYAAALFPESWIPNEDLIEPSALDDISGAFENDWKRVVDYSASAE
ncbi:MAG: hypothetical protein JXQ90_07315 [Cyclobacteriaceae bacterium]